MGYEKELRKHLKDSQLISSSENYTLYYNPKTSSVGIYNGYEFHEVTLEQLGRIVFEDKPSFIN